MQISELFIEIFRNYPSEFAKNPKTSNPYFKEIKSRAEEIFSNILDENNFKIDALGGSGLMPKVPYIIFLATGHKTSKGFYPAYSFNFEDRTFSLSFGHSYNNQPLGELIDLLIEKASEDFPNLGKNKDGYPCIIYNINEIQDSILWKDLESYLDVYAETLDKYADEFEEYLEDKTKSIVKSEYNFSEENIQYLIDEFLKWYKDEKHEEREVIPEYQKYSKEYFSNLSDSELLEEMFQFARNGGYIQSGGHRTAGLLKKTITENTSAFRKHILKIFDEDFDLRKWFKEDSEIYKGFGPGVRSIFLHRIFPDKYPISNEKSRRVFRMLKFYPEKFTQKEFRYSYLINAVKRLIEFRPIELNFYKADAFTHFLIGTEGEIALDKLQHEISPNYNRNVRYWLYAPGKKAEYWDEFYTKGIMGIGWDFLKDLRNYSSKQDIEDQIKDYLQENSPKWNAALACYEFSKIVKPGDVIIAKKGQTKYLGYGIVESDYDFDNSRSGFKSIRKVDWKTKGEWQEATGNIVVKTLTDITKYPEYVDKLKELMGIEEEEPSMSREPKENYSPNFWWLNCNPKIWDLRGTEIGGKQLYTAYNEKGNKRNKFKYFSQVKAGDTLLGYVSTPDKELTSICKVTKELHDSDEGRAFEFEVVEQLDTPISYNELKAISDLKSCEPLVNNQGSLFKVTQDEYEIIRDFIDNINVKIKVKYAPYSKENALEDLFIDEVRFDEIVDILQHKKNIILQGAPGVGKTFIAKRIAYSILKEQDIERVEMIQFHQSYSYEDFIQGYRPNEDGTFKPTNGIFYNFCKKAQRDSEGKPHFFIIDEINRGNLSKIFGELMMLLESDKRGKEFSIPLTYSQNSDERFYIPENLHIIGTMNTADRSLALVDYALRRRFSFITLTPCFDDKFIKHLKANSIGENVVKIIVERMEDLNKIIANDKKNLGEGFRIGHSYFCNFDHALSKDSKDWYNKIIKHEIAPLIKEYWFDDEEEAQERINRLMIT